MRQRILGKTGISVTELALGTWGLSGDGYGPVDEAEQDRVIDRAVALGIRLFETADVYGAGAMESKLGSHLPKDESVRVVTKVGTDRERTPARKCFDPPFLTKAIERSRERLAVDAIDVVLLHNPSEPTIRKGEATRCLRDAVEQGLARAWGVSAGSVEVARAAIAEGAGVISVAYNALFSSDLHDLHGDIEQSGVGVLARSVLGHGLLTGYWSMHKTFASGDHRIERWTPDDLRRRVHQATALRAAIGGTVYTMRATALRYALTNEDVASVVLGPRNVVQLDQLVRESGKGPPYLTEEKLSKLANRLEDLGVKT